MTVKELKAYLNSVPEDASILIKDLEGELIIEDMGLIKMETPDFFPCTNVKAGTKEVHQLEIFVGR